LDLRRGPQADARRYVAAIFRWAHRPRAGAALSVFAKKIRRPEHQPKDLLFI
jgi:hypothetical protein